MAHLCNLTHDAEPGIGFHGCHTLSWCMMTWETGPKQRSGSSGWRTERLSCQVLNDLPERVGSGSLGERKSIQAWSHNHAPGSDLRDVQWDERLAKVRDLIAKGSQQLSGGQRWRMERYGL